MGNYGSDQRSSRGGRDSGRGRSSYGRSERSGGRPSFGRPERSEMFDAVCDKCGRNCQVPFQPRGDKPIYCSDCFEKVDGGSSRSFDRSSRFERSSGGSDQTMKKLDFIEKKLDRLLELIEENKDAKTYRMKKEDLPDCVDMI